MVANRYALGVLLCSILIGMASASGPTFPANVLYYLPITLTNSQANVVAANTPIAIGTTGAGGIIGFNALAYGQYETCSLNNAEFFFANGTIATSWLEGNYLSELTANAACTGTASPNALVNSANVLYWVVIPGTAFLPASSSNTLYIGWAGNTISSANTLFNTANTGEAPQLSCNNPTNTISGCATGQYAKYDNGNSIFSNYYNFAGTSLPATWKFESSFKYNYTNNGLTAGNAVGQGIGALLTPINPANTVAEMYGGWPHTGSLCSSCLGLSNSNTAFNSNAIIGNNAGFIALQSNNAGTWFTSTWPANPIARVYGVTQTATGTNIIYTLNYTSNTMTKTMPPTAYWTISGPAANPLREQWFRTRAMPPNGIMPSVSLGNVIPATIPMTFNSFTSSPALPAILEPKQSITFTASVTGGTGPYTYNFLIVNTTTNTIYASQSGANSLTSNSFVWVVPSGAAGGIYEANVVVTDNTPSTVNSPYISKLTVNPLLSSVQWTALNNPQVEGQTQALTATIPFNVSGQPDVLVQHYNGTLVGYNATSSTSQARGTALMEAVSNEVSRDSIYLKAETYDIGTNTITLGNNIATNINLYGAGKYQTIIQSEAGSPNGNAIVVPGTNSVTADLSLIVNKLSGFGIGENYTFPWGLFQNNYNTLNATLRNVFINGTTDGIYIQSTSFLFTGQVYNSTVKTQWDALYMFAGGGGGTLNVFNSIFNPINNTNTNNGLLTHAAIIVVGTVNAVNSKFYGNGGINSATGIKTNGGTISLFGGTSVPSGMANILALWNAAGTINVNTTFAYNHALSSGVITSIGNPPYSPYSYQAYPNNAPWPMYQGTSPYTYNIVVYNASGMLVYNSLSPFTSSTSNQVSFTQQIAWGLGSFTANIYVTDSATTNVIAFNSLTYFVGASPLICTSPVFSFFPVNALTYTNADPANMMFEAYNGIANVLVNSTPFYTVNGLGAIVVQPGWNFSYTFNSLPAVVVRCVPVPLSFAAGYAAGGQSNNYTYLVVGVGVGLSLALIFGTKMKSGGYGKRKQPRNASG